MSIRSTSIRKNPRTEAPLATKHAAWSHRLTGVVGAAAAVAISTTAASAGGPLIRVSQASPYAACHSPSHGATVYTNAETWPQVATNPANQNNLIGAWQQDRWTNGGNRGLVAGYSFDGGRTWNQTTLPFSRCAPGGLDYERAADPWVSIGPDGTAYAVSLSESNPFSGPTAIAAVTSKDGGRSWGNLRVIQADTNGAVFVNAKPSVTADPTHAGTAYVVWDRSRTAPAGHFRQPAMFSRTTDWGRTWSTPRAIAATGMDEYGTGNVILVNSRTHRLYDFYTFFFCTCASTPEIQYETSDDLGTTWSGSHIVNTLDALGVTDPNTGQPVGSEFSATSQAIDPASGAIYIAWQSPRFHGGTYDEIAFSSSTDGKTWTPEVQISTPTGLPAFLPTLAVANGVVGLTYYDFRNLAPNNISTLPTDLWFKNSNDGGATWSADQHLAGPFDMKAAPLVSFGYAIGDYQGLTGAGNVFVPFFVKTNCSAAPCDANRTDVYATRLTPA